MIYRRGSDLVNWVCACHVCLYSVVVIFLYLEKYYSPRTSSGIFNMVIQPLSGLNAYAYILLFLWSNLDPGPSLDSWYMIYLSSSFNQTQFWEIAEAILITSYSGKCFKYSFHYFILFIFKEIQFNFALTSLIYF